MPAVKFLARLDLEEKFSFLDGHYLTIRQEVPFKGIRGMAGDVMLDLLRAHDLAQGGDG